MEIAQFSDFKNWLRLVLMGKKDVNRGKRRAAKSPDHSTFRDFRQSKLMAIPIFLVIASLIVVPAASNWIPQSQSSTPVIDPAPTLVVSEPSIAPTILPIPTLTFATFNVAKPNNTSVPAWKNRREAIGLTINESNSDVIGIQEATSRRVTGEGGKRMRHWDDVQAMAADGGYVAPEVQEDTCSPNSCINSAHILFKKSRVKQVEFPKGIPSSGQGRLQDIVGGLRYAKNREFSWAYLEGKNGTGTFLAVSVHLNNEKNAQGKKDRDRVGKAFTKWAEKMNKERGLENPPMILMGDFNSYLKREPKGMLYELIEDGWQDSFNAPTNEFKFFEDAYTTSYTSGNRSGWPKRPITSSNPVRIDYVMYRGEFLHADAYQVALRLKKDGTFDNKYRGSDHMMVQAIIRFDPVPKS
jgi:endonuclease/exonuclease/phosphatase family metal-dependent hydrolase